MDPITQQTIHLHLHNACKWMGGELYRIDAHIDGSNANPVKLTTGFEPDSKVISGICTDTRQIQSGHLFFALKGEQFDAHDMLHQIKIEQNLAAAVVSKIPTNYSGVFILVADTRIALQDLSKNWRNNFNIPLAVVTGSNGKTTVKEMLASILHQEFDQQFVATQGNFNNDIGLPLTLLRLTSETQAAAIELGMNHPGETKGLAGISKPTVVLINNAQREHQEFMHTIEAVANEHATAIEALSSSGIAVFPADDDHADIWYQAAKKQNCKVYDFSIDPTRPALFNATFQAQADGLQISVQSADLNIDFHVAIQGDHNAHNALAATTAAYAMGISPESIKNGMTTFQPAKGRLVTQKMGNGWLLIDDTYNANPDSVRAAIQVLAKHQTYRILVLGDMGEVGDQGMEYHQEVGQFAKENNIHLLITMGQLTQHTQSQFQRTNSYTNTDTDTDASSSNERITSDSKHVNTIEDAVHVISSNALLSHHNVTVLVKGSRFMKMERVLENLKPICDQKGVVDAV